MTMNVTGSLVPPAYAKLTKSSRVSSGKITLPWAASGVRARRRSEMRTFSSSGPAPGRAAAGWHVSVNPRASNAMRSDFMRVYLLQAGLR